MEPLRKLAYGFFLLILSGVVTNTYETIAATGTFYGMIKMFCGLIGLLIVFAFHMHKKGVGKWKFEWRLSHIGMVAVILIITGIVINVTCTFLFPDLVGIGNHFTTWGFIVAVIGFFVYAVKEKMK